MAATGAGTAYPRVQWTDYTYGCLPLVNLETNQPTDWARGDRGDTVESLKYKSVEQSHTMGSSTEGRGLSSGIEAVVTCRVVKASELSRAVRVEPLVSSPSTHMGISPCLDIIAHFLFACHLTRHISAVGCNGT